MRKGKRVKVEEFLVDALGREETLMVWPSIAECCDQLGLDHKTIRNRMDRGTALVVSLGEIRYRRIEDEADGRKAEEPA